MTASSQAHNPTQDSLEYIVGIDTGGTFTDCVAIRDDGSVVQAKAFSTPGDFTVGLFQALENLSEDLAEPLASILPRVRLLAHGTTTGLNAFLSRRGARVGLITTRGHEDAILIGRVHQKVAGITDQELTDLAGLRKADPIVARQLIKGVSERTDYRGEILAPLNREELAVAVDELIAGNVESIAVCLLWSFLNPSHERAIRTYIEARAPGIPVSISSDIAPVLGEYERVATTVINAYLVPLQERYVKSLNLGLLDRGLPRPMLMMQSAGGTVTSEEAATRPIQLLFSGPVGGAVGARVVGELLGISNIVTTDVGGTSFDVGLIVEGKAPLARSPVVEKYHILAPTVDIVSVGTGGGSLAWVEPGSRRLNVGPRSAGADPGPACYGTGGTEPTLTDADLVLGRISADRFFGGRRRLSVERAREAIRSVATPLGLDVIEAARGICRVADARMGDLVRRVILERGFDPRDFVLFAFGGAGPVHVGSYAREVGVSRAIISPLAPVLSAFGMATADLLRVYVRSEPMMVPPDLSRLNRTLQELESAAESDFAAMGISPDELLLVYNLDMKFRRQTNQLTVSAPPPPWDSSIIDQLVVRFEEMYERMFGSGTGYRRAGIELSNVRVTASRPLPKPQLREFALEGEDPGRAETAPRSVYFDGDAVRTPIYRMEALRPGNVCVGPAIIEGDTTTLVVHPGQSASVDSFLNMVLTL